nr:hypothetical protein [Tanacetum cinerariifolium]
MHNNIMAAGSKDRPYTLSTVTILAVPATDDTSAVPEQTTVETILNMSPKKKAHYESEKESIHLLLTGIGDEIYSTTDTCKTAYEIWIASERLQQRESLNIQDVNTNLFWEFGKFTSYDGESIESYYSIFYKMMNEMIRNNLTYQKEVNEIRAERIAKNANPLALVVAAQPHPDPYYQAPKSYKSCATQPKASPPTRSNASTKLKGKEIAKPIAPLSESTPKEDSDPKQAQRDKDMKLKRVKDSTYHKEKMLLCKQAKKGVSLQAEQCNWLAETDEENDEQELEAHYSFMEKIQEVPTADSGTDIELLEQVQYDPEYNVFANDRHHSKQLESISNTCVMEKVNSNIILDSPDMCDNDIQCDQNAKDERVVLANLISNLKLDVDENKKIQKQLKKANTSLAHELK